MARPRPGTSRHGLTTATQGACFPSSPRDKFAARLTYVKAITWCTMRNIAIIISLAVSAACAPIQQTANISTPIGQSLRAGVGDEIIRAEGRENLPNVFGRSDIFARTRPTGSTVVTYGGLMYGKAVLLRSGVVTQSDATTMDGLGTATVIGGQNSATAIYAAPRSPNVTSKQQPSIPIEVNWHRNPRVPIAGRTIVIEAADATSIAYHIE
jgi:hypothetical protein